MDLHGLPQAIRGAYSCHKAVDRGQHKQKKYVMSALMCTPPIAGLWSQIKRAPKASIKRKTFEVEGPAKAGAQSLDIRAKQIFLYFQKYNYEVKQTGETITFSGTYAASRGQAAALVFYVFCGTSTCIQAHKAWSNWH